jgi:hypothetical protein
MLTFQQFIYKLNQQENERIAAQELNRFQKLAGLKESNTSKSKYAIQITIYKTSGLLLEHEQYKQFKKTTNRYTKHPEDTSIPVKAHYHVYPSNSKKELYAVNIEDGKAHHKDNRGHQIPQKEADELRSLGVKIPKDNILESRQFTINESIDENFLTTFIVIPEAE